MTLITGAALSFAPSVNAADEECPAGQSKGYGGYCFPTGASGSQEAAGGSCINPVNWPTCFATFAAQTALQIIALLTGFAGLLLNGVTHYTIVDVAQNYTHLGSIQTTWVVLRDLANMSFIFVLLYAAIMTIIGKGGSYQQLIVKVVIAAILINFSMFFTRVVIDISNILAITFYDAIVPGALATNDTTQAFLNTGISSAFMNYLSLQNFYNIADSHLTSMGLITVGIFGSVMLLIAAFSFFAIALMFIIRYVVLILVIILSPIFFISLALPQSSIAKTVGGYASQWKEALFGQAFFAPIYFFMTWVSLRILSGVMGAFGGNGGNLTASALNGAAVGESGASISNGMFEVIVNFSIVITLMILSLIVAKNQANRVGGGFNKITDWATAKAGSATLGVAGRFGRGTLGRAGQLVADNETLKSKAPNSMMARLTLAAGRKTAGASFDTRNAGFASELKAGKGNKGGFADDMKKKVDAEKKYADTFKPSDLVISAAEKELDNVKKNGTRADIEAAQLRLDKLKGVSEDEARKREVLKIREAAWAQNQSMSEKDARKELARREGERLREIAKLKREEGLTQKQAEDRVDEQGVGWKPKTEKGVGNERKEAYAKDRESGTTNVGIGKASVTIPHFDITGRVLAVGAVKKERRAIADAIRKSMKEKKSADKIVEEIQKQAKDASEDTEETTPAAASAAPAAPAPTTPPSS